MLVLNEFKVKIIAIQSNLMNNKNCTLDSKHDFPNLRVKIILYFNN